MTHPLPQLNQLFLTDAGLETDLIFNRGVEVRGIVAGFWYQTKYEFLTLMARGAKGEAAPRSAGAGRRHAARRLRVPGAEVLGGEPRVRAEVAVGGGPRPRRRHGPRPTQVSTAPANSPMIRSSIN